MGVHPSLKIDKAGAQQRTVLTRIERIKELMKKGLWSDQVNIMGLPKTKIVRIKAKKKVKAEEGATAGVAGAAGGAAPAGAAKPAAGAGKPAAAAAKPAAGAKK